MSELTTADGFELVSATHHKKTGDVDVTDSVSVDRWTNYGKDRLYLNGLKTGDGWISLKSDESGGDRWTKVSAERELEGDELTITVGNTRKNYTIVVKVNGEGFESVDEDESEDEPEIVADGGADVTDHVDDETIEDAINDHDDPGHEDCLTINEVRDLLAHVQTEAEAVWGEWMDNIERDDSRVVAETSAYIVLDTGEHDTVSRALETYDGPVTVDDIAERVVSTVHHRLAEHADREYNWGVTYPRVIRKPASAEQGQQYTEAVINSLLRRDLSPGQAWAYYGVEIRGHSRNAWAKRCGYSDHSAVSEPLRKAQSKLP